MRWMLRAQPPPRLDLVLGWGQWAVDAMGEFSELGFAPQGFLCLGMDPAVCQTRETLFGSK